MKRLYSILIAVVFLIVFASPAVADPGTTWEKIFSRGRFQVLNQFGGAAVFDKETGRVWEQSPSTSTFDWVDALIHCYALEVGGRKGWRLPTIEELASLVDTSQPAPRLPAGNPFSNVQSFGYWSATTSASNGINAWGVHFLNGGVSPATKTDGHFVWCVRGGQGIDGVSVIVLF
jgi:hypothetical protein